MTQNYISRTAKCTNCGHEGTLFFTEAEAVEVEKRNIELENKLADGYRQYLEQQKRAEAAEKHARQNQGFLDLCHKRTEAAESEAARLREALESIRDNSGNHSECPVGFCVERVAKEALRPESGEEKPNA